MKTMFLRIFLILTISYCALSYPSIHDNDHKVIKLGNVTGNQYFQATEQIFYICNNNETQPNEESKIEVPDDYVVTPGIGAHKFHLDTKNWNEARNSCIKEGAHLAVINSEEEEKLIQKWVKEKKIGEAWLGYHEQFQKDDWVTTQDQPIGDIGYVHWNNGEPNNKGGVEHCGSYAMFGLNDLNCVNNVAYICKIYLN